MAKIVANTGTRSTKAPLANALGPRKGGPIKGGPMKPGLRPMPKGGPMKGPIGPGQLQPPRKGPVGPGQLQPIPKGRGRGPMKPTTRPR